MIKNRILKYIFLVFIFGNVFSRSIDAQEASVRLNRIGISIAFQTEIRSMKGQEKLREISNAGHSWIQNEDVIHRIISDRESGLIFGYDLVIEYGGAPGRYKVSVNRLSQEKGKEIRVFDTSKLGKGTKIIDTNKPGTLAIEKTIQPLSKYPAPVLVEAGDTIELNILENPKSLEKVVDVIKIVSRSESGEKKSNLSFDDNQSSAGKKTARDFSPETIELKLNDCKFLVNNKQIADLNGTVAGTIPYVYFQDKGIYAFSLFPRKGYDFKKIGTVENNKISFEIEGNNYEIISGSPIMEMNGAWNLWVLYDSQYKPQPVQSSPYLFGTIDLLENLLRKN